MMAPGALPVVLASGSAARQAVLAAAGVRFRVQVAAVDEAAIRGAMRAAGQAQSAALALANAKARHVADPDALVIGADQMLVCGERWFDKPADLAAAREQLAALRGRAHELVTAVACWRGGQAVWQHVARPRLVMRSFSDVLLDAYLAQEGAACLACVGAYRLEGLGLHLFERVEGEHAAVLGLPMLPLLEFLRKAGVLIT